MEEDEADEAVVLEIAYSMLNQKIADLTRNRAWEVSHGSKSLVLEIEELIIKLQNRSYNLTIDEAREIIKNE